LWRFDRDESNASVRNGKDHHEHSTDAIATRRSRCDFEMGAERDDGIAEVIVVCRIIGVAGGYVTIEIRDCRTARAAIHSAGGALGLAPGEGDADTCASSAAKTSDVITTR
jgi:hypothetical protein